MGQSLSVVPESYESPWIIRRFAFNSIAYSPGNAAAAREDGKPSGA
jgi:hypothetical protein